MSTPDGKPNIHPKIGMVLECWEKGKKDIFIIVDIFRMENLPIKEEYSLGDEAVLFVHYFVKNGKRVNNDYLSEDDKNYGRFFFEYNHQIGEYDVWKEIPLEELNNQTKKIEF